jgi:N-acyl-D-glutamate deacylase
MATAQLKSDKQGYDLVIHGGHVIDPETSLDAVRDVGIRGNQITVVVR